MYFKKHLGTSTVFIGEFFLTSFCLYGERVRNGIHYKAFIVALESGGPIALLRTYDHTTTWW